MHKRKNAILANDLAKVQARLLTIVDSKVKIINDINNNLLQAGGKCLRPALYLLCSQSGDASAADSRIAVALAIELTHMASLIHDDIIDNSMIRRGLPTAHSVWGKYNGVLAGDYLFAKAFFVLSQAMGFFAPTQGNKLFALLSDAAGVMCEGEILQNTAKFDMLITEEQYLSIIEKKTAFFLSAVCEMGAISAAHESDAIVALKKYGYSLGMAFQIVDDIADFTSSADKLGKPVVNDLFQGDITLPVIYALQCDDSNRLSNIIHSCSFSEEKLQLCKKIVVTSGGIEYSQQLASQYIENARQAIPDGLRPEVQDVLWTFIDRLSKRITRG